MDKVRKALIQLINELQVVPVMVGEVKAIDKEAMTCDVLPNDGSPEVFGVRLSISEKAKEASVVVIPKKGSSVIIGRLHAQDWFLIQCMSAESVLLNGESKGGVVNWPKAKAELEKMSARIDAIENAIKTATPALGSSDGGTAYKSEMVLQLNASQIKENFNDLENTIVKHG